MLDTRTQHRVQGKKGVVHMSRSVSSFLAELPEEVEIIKVEVGERGNSSQIGQVTLTGDAEKDGSLITVMAMDSGWKTEHSKLRLYAVTSEGKKLRTFQQTHKLEQPTSAISDTHAIMMESRKSMDLLLKTITQQAQIQSATVKTLSDTLAHREEVMVSCLESMIQSREEELETKAANYVLENALMHEAESNTDPYKETAAATLQGILGQLTAPADLTADAIYDAMQQNPQLQRDIETVHSQRVEAAKAAAAKAEEDKKGNEEA